MLEAITVISIPQANGYGIHKSFLSVGDNNNVVFRVDYRIPHLDEEPGLAIVIIWLHSGKLNEEDMIFSVICASH